MESDQERLAVADGVSAIVVHNIGVRLGRRVQPRQADAEQLAARIDIAYARARDDTNAGAARPTDAPLVEVAGSEDVEGDLAGAVRDAERDLLRTAGKAPAVRLVDLILFEALLRGASDVHVQPARDKTIVRYRLDGALHTVRELPGSLAVAVVTRIKVMAGLDVAERRSAQDGRATVTIGGSLRLSRSSAEAGPASRRVDLRISTLPSTYGERVVVRLLDTSRSPHLLSFQALGMPPDVERRYLSHVARANGIVLSTGPTGSGKTTTLYTTLTWVSSTNAGGLARGCEFNIMTIEDPVEYDLSSAGLAAASQTQVDPKKNMTFATGLRHILRQDPDVIMVGEIRDEETARIAVQASLTGHLVLSTLHTNDAASAVVRLVDLGVEPFLVASSLTAVLAQRLVRTIHQPCAGAGCPECLNTGFRGRLGVFELLTMDPALRELVGKHCSAVDIKAAARRAGMVPLREAGETLIRQGATTGSEVARVIDAEEGEL
jgi:general secretion pathway protein E